MILQSGAIGQIILVFGSPGLVLLSPGYLRSCGQGLSHGHWWAGGGGGLFLEVPPPASSRDEAIGSFFFFFNRVFFIFWRLDNSRQGTMGISWISLAVTHFKGMACRR